MATLAHRRVPRRAAALRRALLLTVVGLACAAAGGAPARAVVPSPPAGAPAVESAPSSLVGVSPELPPGVIAASAAAGSHWTAEKPVYGSASTNDIAVNGAAGTTIRVNEIYPTTASGQPANGPFPVLLTMTPYGKGQGGSSTPGSAATASSGSATGGADNYLVQRGYIEVVEDVRGTGDSNGSWGLFDPIQQRDAVKVLNWAAHLPNSNGKVGTYGPSYLGIDQLLLAGTVGKHSPLKAIFPMVPANDIYRDTSFMGGLLDFEFAETYLGLTGTLNTVNPLGDAASDPALLSDLAGIEADHINGLATYHAAQTENILTGGPEAYDGSYWQARNPENMLARVAANHIPTYMVGGEFDIFQNGEPLNYAELQNAWARRGTTAPMQAGQRTTGRYQLIVGPVGAPQWLLGGRRSARARMVRHLAQGREDRHGAHPHPASLLRPGQRAVRRDLDLPLHRVHPDAPVPRRGRDAHPVHPVRRLRPHVVADPGAPAAHRAIGHAGLEPQRCAVWSADRSVVDGRAVGARGHGRVPGPLRHR